MKLRLPASLLLIGLTGLNSYAEHLLGGSLRYRCLGGNFFEIELSLLRECSGFPMVAQELNFTNDCGVVFSIPNLTPSSVESVSEICAGQSAISTCNGGATYDFELNRFYTELYLSPCEEWTISWTICCRPISVNVQSIPGIYLETKLDNITEPCSTAPAFNQEHVPHVCVGQEMRFDAGTTDPDGHRTTYTLIDARYASPLPVSVNYIFPNYGGQPVAGMMLDQETGIIQFTPTNNMQGYIIVVVRVDEYNEDNEWIGMVMRDFPFWVTACENAPPTPESGEIGSTTGQIQLEGPRALRLCEGASGCAQLEFIDPDAGQNLSITSNIDALLPGSTITTTATSPFSVEVCLNGEQATPGTYFFVITVSDDACTYASSRAYVYDLVVDPASLDMDATAMACSITIPFALIDSLAGDAPMGGTWTGPSGLPHSGYFDGTVDGPGIYTYSIGTGDCISTAELEITFLDEDDPLCILTRIHERVEGTLLPHPNPTTGILHVDRARGNQVVVLDLSGQQLLKRIIDNDQGTIELPDGLANGTYLIRVLHPDGGTRTGRFVLAR